MKVTAICMFFAILTHQGNSQGINEIQKKRGEVLEEIVSQLEKRYRDAKGAGGRQELIRARIRLYQFHRDHAKDRAQKIDFQSKIEALRKLQLNELKSSYEEGVEGITSVEVLRAEERHLAAQQKLLELSTLSTEGGDSQSK